MLLGKLLMGGKGKMRQARSYADRVDGRSKVMKVNKSVQIYASKQLQTRKSLLYLSFRLSLSFPRAMGIYSIQHLKIEEDEW
jgi:hypothetical protein